MPNSYYDYERGVMVPGYDTALEQVRMQDELRLLIHDEKLDEDDATMCAVLLAELEEESK